VRNFSVLSDVEFEELTGDLLSAELGVAVERFARGADGGVDLRWRSRGNAEEWLGQCKHFRRSTFAQLLAAARKEAERLPSLAPAGYKFITSFDLTLAQKSKLYRLFADWMTSSSDVMGCRDVDGLLTRHRTVERRHAKLWISSGSQLYWALHSAAASRSSVLRERIESTLPRYVPNRGYAAAAKILKSRHVCIVAGIPGIGKTMLAQVLAAEAMTRGYEPIEILRDVEEGWAALDDSVRQAFIYDDFLG